MTADFPKFAQAVHGRLNTMSKHEMYVVDTSDIFASYLGAFPEGTNKVFRERTEHDCNCCKQFVRSFGKCVAVVNGKRMSVWDGHETLPSPYKEVAERMSALVRQAPITSVFRTKERKFGVAQTRDSKADITWNHFHGVVSNKHHNDRPDDVRGAINTTAQVFRRGIQELSLSAVDTVLDLISDNALYRGDEHKRSLTEFRQLLVKFSEPGADRDLLVWENVNNPVARFRNTVIGTLVQDLSDGVELERAVRSFETKVAPTNFKRTKALITPAMIGKAMETLQSLGLESAVERRFATIADLSVNDVLFVDNAVRSKMRGGIGGLRDLLMDAAKVQPKDEKAIPITVKEFVEKIVPGAQSMSLWLSNAHLPNFVSLTAPQHADAGRIFKWENGFGWSYDGEVTDSIKERVKKAGGNTGAPLRVSLAWNNTDDLDIHADTPDGHIYYGNKAGVQDVDMNVGYNAVRNPVENLSWKSPRNGNYVIEVHNFTCRETKDVGFTIEVECNGHVQQFTSVVSPRNHERFKCLSFSMKGGAMSDLKIENKNLRGGSMPTEKWGVTTERYVRVDTMLNSPNHWEGAGGVGAKHWFFVLDGCKNPDATRGIYNEFLRGDLEQHRKVFEVVGTKTRCAPSKEQVSGVGFTAGRDNSAKFSVTRNGGTRVYEVSF